MRLLATFLVSLAFPIGSPVSAWDEMSDQEDCRIGISWELGTTLLISKPKAPEGNKLTGELMSDDVAIFMTNDDWSSLKYDPEKGL